MTQTLSCFWVTVSNLSSGTEDLKWNGGSFLGDTSTIEQRTHTAEISISVTFSRETSSTIT